MNLPIQDRLKSVPATTKRLATELYYELAPKVLFFFIAFMLNFLLFKLFVSQYSIEFSAFTKAAVAALVMGKIVPVLDWARLGYRLESHRRIVVVAGKTLISLATGTYAFVGSAEAEMKGHRLHHRSIAGGSHRQAVGWNGA